MNKKIRVLLEMRPALEGFAGIPQEVRLLFRGLSTIRFLDVEGMLQTSHRKLARGTPEKKPFFSAALTSDKKINRYSKVIVSMAEKPFSTFFDEAVWFFEKYTYKVILTLKTCLNTKIKLTRFESKNFEDFIWRTLFSKTLPASDFDLVTKANFRVNSVPWNIMHMTGLNTLGVLSGPIYPALDTARFDIFIGQTPYPAKVSKNTKFLIRYHDAIPIFMPHTIPEKSKHQATHFYAMRSNIRDGAWFACVSEATRQDLLKIYPDAKDKAVTIHNMVSHHYFDEESKSERVPAIVRVRLYEASGFLPKFLTVREKENFYNRKLSLSSFKYLIMVSTIEPRKNHLRLLAAWEVIKAEIDENIKLVIVGTLGWDNGAITDGFKPWIDRGDLFMLNSVPSPDLRVLYKHAAATICPSLGEGFDFSGAEAMASGGLTIASDIPVHREVYDDAAEYFDPYSTASLVKALKRVLYEPEASGRREQMRERGRSVASRYQPEVILPQWEAFLQQIVAGT